MKGLWCFHLDTLVENLPVRHEAEVCSSWLVRLWAVESDG